MKDTSNVCPRCFKVFATTTRLLQHMGQPYASCRLRFEDPFSQQLRGVAEMVPAVETPTLEPDLDVMGQEVAWARNTAMDTEEDATMEDETNDSAADPKPSPYIIEEHPTGSQIFGQGTTIMDDFHNDKFSHLRQDHPYYPFTSRDEWELASFLLRSDLSMSALDEFFKISMIQRLSLSFKSAKDLRSRAELLPSGPRWKCRTLKTHYPTKNPVRLFYRDPLECLQTLLENPLFKDFLRFTPFRLFKVAERTVRVFTEWLSSNTAWLMQDELPAGATLIGTIISSDKTTISVMTGHRQAHPLLISLANIDMEFRTKASNHTFLLLAFLPIPKFISVEKKKHGVLEARLTHECLDIVLEPLKKAAEIGIMMNDPAGYRRYCFTPLASCIVDTPESALLAGVAGSTSSVTMAFAKSFGDPFRHESRTAAKTLDMLKAIEHIDPWDLNAYTSAAAELRLSGVHLPFWRDWPLSDPSLFLTPEPLHHWHKMFWDHDVKWCIKVVGAAQFDFRFSILHPHTGFRHFFGGISGLKQVTGREHRDVQRYLIAIIASAVPKGFLIAVRALLDFRYRAQARELTEEDFIKIQGSLAEFHEHKDAVIKAGGRCGKKGKVINHWAIPKLEFLQSVVHSIQASGVAIQWSADITEHAHITEVKNPARTTNNQNYETQICRYLDRREKCCRFDLVTSLHNAGLNIADHEDDVDKDSITSLIEHIEPVSRLVGAQRIVDYFKVALELSQGLKPTAPRPFRTFSVSQIAFHLSRDPGIKRTKITEACTKFKLPDLEQALVEYITQCHSGVDIFTIRARRTHQDTSQLLLPLLEAWPHFRSQSKAYHSPHDVLPSQTVNAAPPCDEWPHGKCDTILYNTDSKKQWPYSGIDGHQIGQLRLIFRLVPATPDLPDRFLAYVQRFDIVPQLNRAFSGSQTARGPYPEPSSSMYVLKRAKRVDGTIIGGVIPLSQIRALVDLVPRFGAEADRRLTKANSLEYSTEFYLNKYFDKEMFFALDN